MYSTISSLLQRIRIQWSEIEPSLLGCMAILPRVPNLSLNIDDLFHVKSLRSKLKLRSPQATQLVSGYVSIICIRRLVSGKISCIIYPRDLLSLTKLQNTDAIYLKPSKKEIKNVNYLKEYSFLSRHQFLKYWNFFLEYI